MDAKTFWSIVELRSRAALRERFEAMTAEELGDFYWTAKDHALEFMDEQYSDQMETPSEDEQYDIANWIVLHGKAFYEDHLAHPEKFPDSVPLDPDEDWDLLTLSNEVYEERFDGDVYDHEPAD